MAETAFNLDGYLNRIGYAGTREASLPALRGMIAAHSASIPFENIDPFLGRAPKLDVASLQAKMVASRRRRILCFEHNALLRAGLIALGFDVTSLVARVVLGGSADALHPASPQVVGVGYNHFVSIVYWRIFLVASFFIGRYCFCPTIKNGAIPAIGILHRH